MLAPALGPAALAQRAEGLTKALHITTTIAVPNITYLTANNWDAKLTYQARDARGPNPTLIYFHGGDNPRKQGSFADIPSFLEMGGTW